MKEFFSRSESISVLHGFNPWWSGKPSVVPHFRRLAHGACRKYLDNPSLKRAILLSGPRRVGKTTILLQLAEALIREGGDPKSILYLSLDHPMLKLLSLRDILSLYHESIHPEDKASVLLFDEVQYSREWETEVKLLVDHSPQCRIVATGSAAVLHGERLAESGVGRWITVSVPTLSFYEFICIREENLQEIPARLRPKDLFTLSQGDMAGLSAKFRPLLPLFQRYLLVGGFPETARLEEIGLCQRLLREDVVERVLKRDMTALFGVRNVNDMEKLLSIFASIREASWRTKPLPTLWKRLPSLSLTTSPCLSKQI